MRAPQPEPVNAGVRFGGEASGVRASRLRRGLFPRATSWATHQNTLALGPSYFRASRIGFPPPVDALRALPAGQTQGTLAARHKRYLKKADQRWGSVGPFWQIPECKPSRLRLQDIALEYLGLHAILDPLDMV